MGPYGAVGVAADITDFHANSNWSAAGSNVVAMAPYDKAMCAFTEIGGDFNGAGEAVRISSATGTDNVKRWWLSAVAGSGTGTHATARCFARDQQ